jgi:hypothetical protein
VTVEERLRHGLEARAGLITPDRLRPAEVPTGRRSPARAVWAVAAAVLVVVALSVGIVLGRQLLASPATPVAPATTTPVAPPTPAAKVPAPPKPGPSAGKPAPGLATGNDPGPGLSTGGAPAAPPGRKGAPTAGLP